MYFLKDDEIEYIRNDITNKGITLPELKEDLVDHICCVIENEYDQNQDFKKFYKSVIRRFFHKELKEIELETINLLTFKNYYAMKKTFKITGITSTLLMILGSVFKLMHWPGAAIILVSAVFVFSLIFLPLMIILKTKDDVQLKDKLVFSLGSLLGTTASLGVLFKVMHWTGANILMFGSLGAFLLLYVPLYFALKIRDIDNKFNTVVNTVLMIAAGGILFSLVNVHGSHSLNNSLIASYDFLEQNTSTLISLSEKNNSSELTRQTHELIHQIKDLKKQIISASGGMTDKSIGSLANPKSSKAVKKVMTKETITNLKQSCELINQKLNERNLPSIEVNQLQLEGTISSVALLQLTELQNQLAMVCLVAKK